MVNYSESDNKNERIFQVAVNIIAGIAMLYYFAQIGQQFHAKDVFHFIILGIFAIKFVMDVAIFKVGFASFSLLLLFLPILSILGFAPSGEVQPLFNDRTQLIEKHFYILAFAALFFYFIWSLLLVLDNKSFKKYDAVILKFFFRDSNSLLSTWFFSVVAIASAIIYLPDLPGKAYHEFSPSLLPGNAWNSVVAISYFFVLIGVKGSMLRKAALLFVPFWLLSHYARVDILGLILILYVIITNTKKGKIFKANFNFKKFSIIAIGLLVFSYLGIVRHNGLVFDAAAILDSFAVLVNYPTVQDLVYSTAAAIEVTYDHGTVSTLLGYIPQLMPSFLGSEAGPGAAHLVAESIHTNYGLFIYGEYFLNYQVIGVILAPFLTYLVVFIPALMLRKLFGDFGFSLGYYLIVTTIARVFWYGYIYYIKPMLVIVPVFILIYLVINALEKDLAGKPVLKFK